MNTGFYKDLDTNFEQACYLSEKDFSHEELLEMLKNGNIPQKQIAALKLDFVLNIDDAGLLISNLTGCDGKIREAVAFKLFQLINTNSDTQHLFSALSPKIYADATIDINANICRLVVDSVKYLKNNSSFIQKYTDYILKYTNEALDELDKFILRDKKYIINKQLFKLYWCLETLKNFHSDINSSDLYQILERTADLKEYTVREKAAQIVLLSGKFPDLRIKLSNDANYYVRAVFLNH